MTKHDRTNQEIRQGAKTMKATQFIKDHGLRKAREVLNDQPAKDYFTCFCEGCGWGGSSQKLNVNSYDRDWISCPKCYSEKIEFEDVVISELKRLVESVDFIKREFGTIEIAKIQAEGEFESSYWLLVHKAIADYESIYGEGNE